MALWSYRWAVAVGSNVCRHHSFNDDGWCGWMRRIGCGRKYPRWWIWVCLLISVVDKTNGSFEVIWFGPTFINVGGYPVARFTRVVHEDTWVHCFAMKEGAFGLVIPPGCLAECLPLFISNPRNRWHTLLLDSTFRSLAANNEESASTYSKLEDCKADKDGEETESWSRCSKAQLERLSFVSECYEGSIQGVESRNGRFIWRALYVLHCSVVQPGH